MASGIIKIIDEQYSEISDDDCLDIFHIKSICKLYNAKGIAGKTITLSELNFSTPEFKKAPPKSSRKKHDFLKTPEFTKKYAFFIRIIYACLKINVTIIDQTDDVMTLKNNYHLIRSLELTKKQLIIEHLGLLKNYCKNITNKIDSDYELYVKNFTSKVKIIDKIMISINKLIKADVFEKTDNMLSLLLPYFYTYTEFIEEYN